MWFKGAFGDGLRENQKRNDVPIYLKIFFREIYKCNKTNIIALNYYHNGGVYVLLGNNRKEWLVSNTHIF